MSEFQPPPTYAELVLVDPVSGKGGFNPIWLKWFVDIAEYVSNQGSAAKALVGGDPTQTFQVGTATAAAHAVRLDQLNALRYVSAPVAVPAANTPVTSTHGLGAQPTFSCVSLVCVTAELGYVAGEEIPITGFVDGDAARSITTWATTTVVGWIAHSNIPTIKRRDTGALAAITNANWNLIFRAWR